MAQAAVAEDWRQWPAEHKARLLWRLTARPEQLTPPGDWRIWLLMAGRGFGKTRSGAEDCAHYALSNPGARIAVVAPTYSDARDTCVEGESGLMAILPRSAVTTWNRSLGEVLLVNGSRIKLFSADEPNRLRGPQHHRAWADELAAWTYPEAWDQLMFGLRLGSDPRAVVTTTPRPTPLIRDLRKRVGTDVHLTTGSTFDNSSNLAPSVLEQLRARYEGTRLGRQELYAHILDDAPGALWRMSDIDLRRVTDHCDLARVVVGVDPAGTATEDADATGIVVAGLGVDGDVYVLADRSCRLSPDGWGRRAIGAYEQFKGDRIVAERNFGGDMVEHVLRTVDPNVPVRMVTASRGKEVRAGPVAALYEQGKVHHVGGLPELEDELCNWVPGDRKSPDRLDALVWALTDLKLGSTAQAVWV